MHDGGNASGKAAAIIAAAVIALCCSAPSRTADPALDRTVRGISFLPTAARTVDGTVKIDVPLACTRTDSKHEKDKYPIAFFTAGCAGAGPCLSLSVMVMVIPESTRGFDEVVSSSRREDFGSGEVRKVNEALITSSGSGADRISLHYGPSYLAGNHIIGCFHSAEKKKTAKVVLGLTFIEPLTEDEWRAVLVHSVNILKSLEFLK